ncbi:MAG: hypothetical protein JXA57_11605 [Armatimonadetes bacterium]|nr:hypothetical protein [Armatimonadota bacterium]
MHLRPMMEKGTYWPDVLGADGALMGLYVSEAVIEDWDRSEVKYGVVREAVVDEPYPAKLRSRRPPPYYYVEAHAGAQLDLRASGYEVRGHCSRCGRATVDPLVGPERYMFEDGTWDGSDVFNTRSSGGIYFCTEKVLLLAREKRRTNFRFVPADALQRHASGWRGIDYLGEKWPPKWYPDPPDAGKTPEQWLSDFKNDLGRIHYPAIEALLEIGSAAVPGLLRLVRTPVGPPRGRIFEIARKKSGRLRFRALGLLSRMRREGITIGAEAEGLLEDEAQAAVNAAVARQGDEAIVDLLELMEYGWGEVRVMAAKELLKKTPEADELTKWYDNRHDEMMRLQGLGSSGASC